MLKLLELIDVERVNDNKANQQIGLTYANKTKVEITKQTSLEERLATSEEIPFINKIVKSFKNQNETNSWHSKIIRLKSMCSNSYLAIRKNVVLAKCDEEKAFQSQYCKLNKI